MTREDQRVAQELKKALNKTCREIGKRRGRKTIFDRERAVKVNLRCKPLAVNEMYWDVFQMAEEAAKQPFSFYVAGAFTARDWCAARLREAEG